MKNLYSKNEFIKLLEQNKSNDNELNEGLFQFLNNMYNKISTYAKKIKGGQKIEDIFNKYIKIIDDEFKKKVNVDLGLSAEEQLNGEKTIETGKATIQNNQQNNQQNTQQNTQQNNQETKKNESVRVKINNINEDIWFVLDKD